MDDLTLVNGLKEGNTEAIRVLLQQYSNRLYNYAFYRCGDHHLAEDIVSDTLIRILEKISNYEQGEVPFRAWVFRITHNLLVNHLRYRTRHAALSLDAVNADGIRVIDPPDDYGAADGGRMSSQLVEREELRQAILELPEEQKVVFVLRFVEGFDLEEVAGLLEKSLASIKSLQYRAVLNLRQKLDQEDQAKLSATKPVLLNNESQAKKSKPSRVKR